MSTKYNRAKQMALIGPYHASFDAMWDVIPASAVQLLPSQELAALVDSLWALASASKDIGAREVMAEATWIRRGPGEAAPMHDSACDC